MEKIKKHKCGRALVTRPIQDAEKTRARLRESGFEVMIEPMLEILPVFGSKPQVIAAISRKPQAILMTSANGVRMIAGYTDEREISVFAVGDMSAETATELGFKKVESASGDVSELAKLVKNKCKPENGFLLHLAGSVVAGELKEYLEKAGFEVQRITTYEARAMTKISPGVKVAIANCEIDFVIFYSARTAKIFESLMVAEKLEYLAPNIEIYCLSKSAELNLDWKKVHIAKRPNEEELLQLIDRTTSDRLPKH